MKRLHCLLAQVERQFDLMTQLSIDNSKNLRYTGATNLGVKNGNI